MHVQIHTVHIYTCHLIILGFGLQRWAHAYRDLNFNRSVDTNNGTEALNKVLKYSYLPKRRSLTLSLIVTLLLEKFLPDCYQKYLFQNFRLTSFNRSYKTFVPCYLHDRPRNVILHCVDRKSSSRKFSENDINQQSRRVYSAGKNMCAHS